MIVDAMRQVADWLRDPTDGLAVHLAAVPHEGSEAAPTAPTVLDALTTAWVARGLVPREELKRVGAVLCVRVAEEAVSPFTTYTERGERVAGVVPIALLYAVLADQSDVAARDAYQVLRVAHRVLARRFTASAVDEFVRNGVALGAPTHVTYVPTIPDAPDSVIAAALVLEFPVTDPWALGAL